MYRSLPRQLFLYLVPGILLVLVVAGIYLEVLLDKQLVAYFDTTLDAKARSIFALTEQDEDGVELEVYDVALPSFSQITDPDYFHIVNSSGETLFVSPSADGFAQNLPASEELNEQGVIEAFVSLDRHESLLHYFDHELPDGRSGRWIALSYFPRIDDDDDDQNTIPSAQALEQALSVRDKQLAEGLVLTNGVLIAPERVLTFVGTSRSALDQLLWAIDIALLLTGIVIAAAIVFIVGFGIRRAIAPLDKLGADIAALDERSLNSRITLTKPSTELNVLVKQFNLLLERLETAFSRERQFSADVAHELRTPIAEMRNLIEVSTRFPDNKVLAAAYSADLLGSTERMQRVVEQLMLLSRAEQDSIDLGGPINLVSLLRTQIESLRAKATVRGMNMRLTTDSESLKVMGLNVWPLIMANVLDNTIYHASEASTINCELHAFQESFSLIVSNPCSDLEEADMAFLSSRLWRKDSARTDSSHSGLGLALVVAYAQRLNVKVAYSLASTNGDASASSVFSISFTGERLINRVVT